MQTPPHTHQVYEPAEATTLASVMWFLVAIWGLVVIWCSYRIILRIEFNSSPGSDARRRRGLKGKARRARHAGDHNGGWSGSGRNMGVLPFESSSSHASSSVPSLPSSSTKSA